MIFPPVGASVEVVVEDTAPEGRRIIAQRLWRWEKRARATASRRGA